MRKIEEMTLRDRVAAAQRLSRDLVEHLDQGFIPKVHQLRRVTRSDSQGVDKEQGPSDRTVHSAAAGVLEADHYTVKVYQRLIAHGESVRRSVHEIIES